MKPYYEDAASGIVIYHGRAEDVMPTLAADAILTDPPFGVRSEDWDDMDDREFARFSMAWLSIAAKVAPSLVTFTTQNSAIHTLARLLYPRVREMVWYKPPGSQYAGASERHLWFSYEPILHCYTPETWSVVKPKDAEVGRVIRAAREKMGLSRGAVDIALRGKKTGLCYRWEEGACLPTPEQAEGLKRVLRLNGEMDAALSAAYVERDETKSLAAQQAALNAADKTDVFAHRTITNGWHPCEKPVGLLLDILGTALRGSRKIIDPFCGSGSTLVAAREAGIQAVGIEQDERHCESAVSRLAQGVLFGAEGGAA